MPSRSGAPYVIRPERVEVELEAGPAGDVSLDSARGGERVDVAAVFAEVERSTARSCGSTIQE